MNNRFSLNIVKPLFVVLLIIVAWLPQTYSLAEIQINDSLKNGAVVYGIARSLNAVISVLQSTEVSAVFATLTIGEILDPLNDLIERFSDLMTVALASLAIQKLLLAITSTSLFSFILTALGAGYLGSYFWMPQHQHIVLRAFFWIVFIRLSFTFVVLVNGYVDNFVTDHFQIQEEAKLQTISTQLKSKVDVLEAQKNLHASEIDNLLQRKRVQERVVVSLQSDMIQLRVKIKDLKESSNDCPIWKPSTFCNDADKRTRNQIKTLEQQVDILEVSIKGSQDLIDQLNSDIECLENRQAGKTCSLLERLTTTFPDPREKLDQIATAVDQTVSSVFALISVFVFKTILSPLLFWWLFYSSMRWLLVTSDHRSKLGLQK